MLITVVKKEGGNLANADVIRGGGGGGVRSMLTVAVRGGGKTCQNLDGFICVAKSRLKLGN